MIDLDIGFRPYIDRINDLQATFHLGNASNAIAGVSATKQRIQLRGVN